jgi:hypothetical protein
VQRARNLASREPRVLRLALLWRLVANDRDNETGDSPNDDRCTDYGEAEHQRRAESERQPAERGKADAPGKHQRGQALPLKAHSLFLD